MDLRGEGESKLLGSLPFFAFGTFSETWVQLVVLCSTDLCFFPWVFSHLFFVRFEEVQLETQVPQKEQPFSIGQCGSGSW